MSNTQKQTTVAAEKPQKRNNRPKSWESQMFTLGVRARVTSWRNN